MFRVIFFIHNASEAEVFLQIQFSSFPTSTFKGNTLTIWNRTRAYAYPKSSVNTFPIRCRSSLYSFIIPSVYAPLSAHIREVLTAAENVKHAINYVNTNLQIVSPNKTSSTTSFYKVYPVAYCPLLFIYSFFILLPVLHLSTIG